MLSDFKIVRKIGNGSYGKVYEVIRISDGMTYALKRVKIQSLSQPEKMNALNEIRIIASIQSDFVVQYKESFIDLITSDLCIIMEYVGGGDLHQQIVQHNKKGVPFNEQQVWKTLVQVSRGLKVLHDQKVVHRDIKSANIFLDRNGNAKLGDFNVAKLQKRELLFSQTGTPIYASPEMWKCMPYDEKTDIWSLGCILYEMCALKPPFQQNTPEETYKLIQMGKFQPLSEDYSKNLRSIIYHCLQVSPFCRPSATEIVFNKKLPEEFQIKNNNNNLQQQNNQFNMMATIKYPEKMGNPYNFITNQLPQSNYSPIKIKSSMLIKMDSSANDPCTRVMSETDLETFQMNKSGSQKIQLLLQKLNQSKISQLRKRNSNISDINDVIPVQRKSVEKKNNFSINENILPNEENKNKTDKKENKVLERQRIARSQELIPQPKNPFQYAQASLIELILQQQSRQDSKLSVQQEYKQEPNMIQKQNFQSVQENLNLGPRYQQNSILSMQRQFQRQ